MNQFQKEPHFHKDPFTCSKSIAFYCFFFTQFALQYKGTHCCCFLLRFIRSFLKYIINFYLYLLQHLNWKILLSSIINYLNEIPESIFSCKTVPIYSKYHTIENYNSIQKTAYCNIRNTSFHTKYQPCPANCPKLQEKHYTGFKIQLKYKTK